MEASQEERSGHTLSTMETTASIRDFECALREVSPAIACCLASRAALRVAPLLVESLHLNGDVRRGEFVLPSFRLLAAVRLASTWPTQAPTLLARAGTVARELGNTAMDTANSLQVNVIECQDVFSDMPLYVRQFEDDANAFMIAEHVLSAIVSAVQATVDAVDASNGIASRDAVYEAMTDTLRRGQYALDCSKRFIEFQASSDGDDSEDPALSSHTTEYWDAVRHDFGYLQAVKGGMDASRQVVSALFGERLWLNDMPVWAGRTWAEFKDQLPDAEGWAVWVEWYEARLVGRPSIEAIEVARLTILEDDWKGGPQRANLEIARAIQEEPDPLVAAISQGLEEVDEIKLTIDLTQHRDRIRSALRDDPSQVIGATKDMLEATMKTILRRRGKHLTGNIQFSRLTDNCLSELGLKSPSNPKTDVERYLRRFASSAERMLNAVNDLRNFAGTGHGRPVGEEPVLIVEDANFVASIGMVLAAWLIRRQAAVETDSQNFNPQLDHS